MSLRGVQGVLLALLILVVWPIEAQLSDLVFCFAKSSGPCNATTPCKKKKEICVNTLAGEICCKSNKVKASPTTTTTTTTDTPPDPNGQDQPNDQSQPNDPDQQNTSQPVDPNQDPNQQGKRDATRHFKFSLKLCEIMN
ncbi:hypothetical protein GCK32_020520 [Trichostrongylus colubriformis]|uniref:Uncharacterized protein n=1 Tax=Trichostrongylus colubriformis TaxID=6319 RepID=A0AAN8G741_TRICO